VNFCSILFDKNKDIIKKETLKEPDFFIDLNLDQIINTITEDYEEYGLKPFFYNILDDIDLIKYRQEVARDLENKTLLENIKSFALKMNKMHQYLAFADKLHYKYHKKGWFLEAADIYCEAVNCLANDILPVDLKSRGLLAFRRYLKNYIKSSHYTSLMAETKKLKTDLSEVKYCILIKGNFIKVRKYESEIDYSVVVEKTFEKFKKGAVKDYRIKLPFMSGMNHVEAKILNLVAKLYPDIFLNLDNYCNKNINFLDETIGVFNREIQFYISYLEYIEKLEKRGLKFCYPKISNREKEIYDCEGFDLALAYKLMNENLTVVCNDFYLEGKERVFVISGPNQGGKTTFARMFGQLHYLASIGLAVPGRKAKLFLFDRIFTHFEKEEDIRNLRGKLEDDLVRIYSILNQATSKSIVVMNEIFTSTTLKDAIFLGKKIMEKIIQMDFLCVYVTFIIELANLSYKTVSMVSTVEPENPALRTYKIIRKHADGLAYAISIAEKYHLTYDYLKEYIKT
jgi:DNA mismatch repair ATPase MutS